MSTERAISHSAGPCETAPECLMEASAVRFTACDSELQAQCRVVSRWADISVWKRGCDRALSGLLVCITSLSRWAAVCCMLFARLSIELVFELAQTRVCKHTLARSQKQCEGSPELRDEGF